MRRKMVKTINRSDSQDNNKSDNSDSDTVTYNIINLPPIDMSNEVNLLTNALRKMTTLIAIEEDINNTDKITKLAASSIDIANTIKYLKSGDIEQPTKHNCSSDDDFFTMLGLDDE